MDDEEDLQQQQQHHNSSNKSNVNGNDDVNNDPIYDELPSDHGEDPSDHTHDDKPSGKRKSSSGAYEMIPLDPSFAPTSLDVICARGKEAYNHIGNVRFRAMVQDQLHLYSSSASKVEKSKIVRDIIESVRRDSPQGGFVKKVNGKWFDVGERARREKTGQQIRDLLHTQYRSSTKAKARTRKCQRSGHSEDSSKANDHLHQLQSSAGVAVVATTEDSSIHDHQGRYHHNPRKLSLATSSATTTPTATATRSSSLPSQNVTHNSSQSQSLPPRIVTRNSRSSQSLPAQIVTHNSQQSSSSLPPRIVTQNSQSRRCHSSSPSGQPAFKARNNDDSSLSLSDHPSYHGEWSLRQQQQQQRREPQGNGQPGQEQGHRVQDQLPLVESNPFCQQQQQQQLQQILQQQQQQLLLRQQEQQLLQQQQEQLSHQQFQFQQHQHLQQQFQPFLQRQQQQYQQEQQHHLPQLPATQGGFQDTYAAHSFLPSGPMMMSQQQFGMSHNSNVAIANSHNTTTTSTNMHRMGGNGGGGGGMLSNSPPFASLPMPTNTHPQQLASAGRLYDPIHERLDGRDFAPVEDVEPIFQVDDTVNLFKDPEEGEVNEASASSFHNEPQESFDDDIDNIYSFPGSS